MRREYLIIAIWFLCIVLVGFLYDFPHRTFDAPRTVNLLLQVLLGIMGIAIAWGSTSPQRYVFLNFAFYFLYAIPTTASSFAGMAFLSESVYGPFYYHLYVNKVGQAFMTLFPLMYGILDFAKQIWTVPQKYLAAFGISVVVVFAVFGTLAIAPTSIFQDPDYRDYEYLASINNGKNASAETIVKEYMRVSAEAGNLLSDAQARERIEAISPYLEPGGATQLFWRPAERDLNIINVMSFLTVLVLLLLFYTKIKPSGAYLDKMYLGLGLFFLMEVAHEFGSITSAGQTEYLAMYEIGQYFTIGLLLYFVLIFDLKLNFVVSPAGRYYETALYADATKVMVFRDWIDRIIQLAFFRK